jgi:hypothetical protein
VSQQTTDRSFDDLARALAEGSISRRRALKLFAGTAIAALIPSRALAQQQRVTICHKPGTPDQKTMEVPESAVDSHQRHGDRLGPCESPTTTTTAAPTTSTTSTTSTSTSTTSTTPICFPEFAECTADTQCCSRICDSPSFPDLCQQCRFPGGSCTAGETCCDVGSSSGPSFCVSGKCCAPEQRTCNANIACCPGLMCVNIGGLSICVS